MSLSSDVLSSQCFFIKRLKPLIISITKSGIGFSMIYIYNRKCHPLFYLHLIIILVWFCFMVFKHLSHILLVSKKADTSLILIVFWWCSLWSLVFYCYCFSFYHFSTWIKYQKNYILVSNSIEVYPVNTIWLLKMLNKFVCLFNGV